MMPTHPLRHLISSSHVTTSGYSADPAAGHSLSAEPPPGRKSHRCTPSRNQGHMGGGEPAGAACGDGRSWVCSGAASAQVRVQLTESGLCGV